MFREGEQRERTLRRGLESAYWLIEKTEGGPMEVLTIDLREGQRALSVFSHREEAEMFLWLGRLTDGWRARKSEGPEIARMLSGPCATIDFVVLDPLPEMLVERTLDLVSLTRERFTDRLTGGGQSEAARGSSERTEPESGAGYRALVP